MRVYNLWSVNHSEKMCPAPIDMCDDIIQFILSCLGIENKLNKIEIWKVLKFINEWNGNDNNDATNECNKTEDLKDSGTNSNLEVSALRMSKTEAGILIDLLCFGALSYLQTMEDLLGLRFVCG